MSRGRPARRAPTHAEVVEVAREERQAAGFGQELLNQQVQWFLDPVQFVRDQFGCEPDEWQVIALRAIAASPRVAMKACKGPGKSCVLAWIIWWFLATRPHAQIIALSITQANLKDGLWKELTLWYGKSPFLQTVFEVKAERIFCREHPKTWWCSARAFAQSAEKEQQANTLAGLHGEHVMVVLDEVSDYPAGVVAAAEGIFANDVEAKLVIAGNPTRTEGPLYEACTRLRHRYEVIEITGDPDDPKRSPRIKLEYAREQIADWGRDNPWVMVNILGLFPPVQEDKLLGPNDITLAERRDAPPHAYQNEPIIWGLDVARFGSDTSRLRKRQGPILFRGHQFRNLDGPTLAQRVALIIEQDMAQRGSRRPDYIMVDVTGVGSSPYDHLCLLGYRDIAVPVDFGGGADEERFADKRAEMWWRAANWVRKEGCLPTGSNVLGQELCAPTFKFSKRGKRTCFVLQSKEEMRSLGLQSPDDADALALTFFHANPLRRDFSIDPLLRGAQHRCLTEDDLPRQRH